MSGGREVYRPAGEALCREVEGRHVIVPIRENRADMEELFSLNAAGAFVWEHLDGRRSLEEIAALVSKRFDVGGEQAGRDVREFIGGALAAGLVEQV